MLINLRNALMTGRRLPYGAEVEYLESTGTQWIDTGYSFNSATDKVELVFELLTTTPNYKWIFGAYDTKRLAIGSGDGISRRTLGYNASTSYNSSTYYTDGAHIFLADSTGASIDGQNFFGFADFSTTSHILLYTIPLNPSAYCSNVRIWSYKHYRNGVLVRDFIPVRKGTVGYLYDRVSGKLFGNAGTGVFSYGSDVVPVEYIESHGTEYIDTGVVPTTTKTEITFSTPTPPSSGYMCGSFNANNNRYYPAVFSGSSTKYINLINAANTVISQHINDGNVHTVVYNATGGACYFDGEAAGTLSTTTLTASNPIYLFRASGASGLVSGRIYSCKLYDANDTPVRKFRPVRVGTEGAMMDTLTRRIYRNAGTGAFTYGNDLKYPIPSE